MGCTPPLPRNCLGGNSAFIITWSFAFKNYSYFINHLKLLGKMHIFLRTLSISYPKKIQFYVNYKLLRIFYLKIIILVISWKSNTFCTKLTMRKIIEIFWTYQTQLFQTSRECSTNKLKYFRKWMNWAKKRMLLWQYDILRRKKMVHKTFFFF